MPAPTRLVTIAGGLLAALPSVATEVPGPPAGRAQWYAQYQLDSRLVTLPGGRQLNLYCVGSGATTVILEAGIGETAFTWWAVQDRIAKRFRVCAYDRAGLGKSPSGPLPRDTRAEVSDLEALLPAAGLKPPFILVGHSMGGYNVRLFASRHRKDVAGLVLVDPSAENQLPIMEAALPDLAKGTQNAIRRARTCADPARSAEFATSCAREAPAGFSAEQIKAFAATQSLAASQTFSSEVESFVTLASKQIIAERRSFGTMPLIVLTRTERSTNMPADQAATELRIWNDLHEQIVKLSRNGIHRAVPGASHYIQLDRPYAVIEAVFDVAEKSWRRR